VDRLATDEGKTFHPDLLFLGGDGNAQFNPSGTTVTARVVGHALGDKVRIGKYRPKTGYKRHTGFRAKLSQIQIEAIGAGRRAAAAPAAPKREAPAAPKKEAPAALKKEAPAAKPKETTAAAAQPPRGYADFTVAEITEKAKRWKLESVEAALEYEHAHAKRKGAIAALESALEAKKEK
jgi:ribosomal protein L21